LFFFVSVFQIINNRETGMSRGFGFVTFSNEKSMRDAIEGMNGHSLDGCNITVNEAQSRGNGGGDGGGGGYSRGGGSKIEEDSLILTQINQSHGFCSGFQILKVMMMKSS
jgi:RNA recognition motif-containing protein